MKTLEEIEVKGQRKLILDRLIPTYYDNTKVSVDSLTVIKGHHIRNHTARISELRKELFSYGYAIECLEHWGTNETWYRIVDL